MYCILFDMDGTLVDSEALIIQALQEAFLASGLRAPDPSAIRRIVGLSLPLAIETLGVDAKTNLLNEVADNYKYRYATLRDIEGHPEPLFDGAINLIKSISQKEQVLLGIATGKSMKGVHQVLKNFDLADYFQTIQTADNAPSKPHPAMIHQALRETGVKPNRAIMIGDTTFDMEMANAAKIKSIGVTWGHHASEELQDHNPTHMVDHMHELEIQLHEMTNEDSD